MLSTKIFLLANSDVTATQATYTSKEHSSNSGEKPERTESEGPSEDRMSHYWQNRVARLFAARRHIFAAVFCVVAGATKEATETNLLTICKSK